MGFAAKMWLNHSGDESTWERLTDLVKLVPVTLTTKQHPTRTFGGKPVVVLDRAYFNKGTDQEESIEVDRRPDINAPGGEMTFKELTATYQAKRLSKKPAVVLEDAD